PVAAELEFAERSEVERMADQAIAARDGPDRLKPTLGTLMLAHGDGAVECHDRRRANGYQRVVERTSATCASSASRGWQHENIIRSKSSLMVDAPKTSSTKETSVHSLSSSRPSSGAKVRAVRPRRSTSMARAWRSP